MLCFHLYLLIVFVLQTLQERTEDKIEIDVNGYIMYCPCMGRFGNQADQFIGAIAFTKSLNRTLVLPPWIVYPSGMPFKSLQIPFDRWFQIKPLLKFTKVITMEVFMAQVAKKIWSKEQRIGFCYSFRDEDRCAMKDGNPFGPFWDNFNVSFASYVEHYGLLWDVDNNEKTKIGWLRRYPANLFPVISFQGAPGHFPSMKSHQYIQKFIYFSQFLEEKKRAYITEVMQGKKFVAIHLRNGIDFTRVCADISTKQYSKLFASVQCTGYNNEYPLTFNMCNPSTKEIIKQVKKYVKKVKAEALFIATDHDPLLKDFQKISKKLQISIFYRKHTNEEDDPLIDIAILSSAEHFIGNCVSTFSAFVRRQRESRNLPVSFFGIDYLSVTTHSEL